MTSLRRTPLLVATLALLAPAVGGAQDSASAPAAPPPPAPAALTVDSLAGRRLAEGAWSYVASVTRRGATAELGRRTLTVRAVDAAEAAGGAAWLLLDETDSNGQALHDSLFVRRDDLRPLRRHVRIGPMEVRLEFRGDSIVGGMTVPEAAGAPIALETRPGLVVNSGMLESLLSIAPLGPEWRATVHQLAVSPVGSSLVPLTLSVVGEESVTVPAGTFSAWIVELATPEVAQRLWVDRETGRVVRTHSPAPNWSDVEYETVLVERQPG